MDDSRRKHIYCIFALKNLYEYIPFDIIRLIIMIDYPYISISCGEDHTCLLIDNDVYVCGRNCEGQLCLGINQTHQYLPLKLDLRNIKAVACGNNYTIALTISGEV